MIVTTTLQICPVREFPDESSQSCAIFHSTDKAVINRYDAPKIGTREWIRVHKGITQGYVQGCYLQPFAAAGLHGPADPDAWAWDEEAFNVVFTSNVSCVKLLGAGNIGASVVKRLHDNGIFVMARAFNKITDTKKDGIEYMREILESLMRLYEAGVRYFELFNEPNLYIAAAPEGMGISWNNGEEFGIEWLKAALFLQQYMPDALFGFPAMSPGSAIPNFRYDPYIFLAQAGAAIEAADFMCFHTYWDGTTTYEHALTRISQFAVDYDPKPIYVTEFSNTAQVINRDYKGDEYANFYLKAPKVLPSTVCGLYSYCLSASDPKFLPEMWKGSDIPNRVGKVL